MFEASKPGSTGIPYAIGSGGAGGSSGSFDNGAPGSAGGTTSLQNIFSINGGGGGPGAGPGVSRTSPGTNVTTAASGTINLTMTSFKGAFGLPGNQGGGGPGATGQGSTTPGSPGAIVIFSNDAV